MTTTNDSTGGRKTFLVFGATGQTGKHFVQTALDEGHRVKALVRTPAKLPTHPDIEVFQGSITEAPDLDRLVHGVDAVVVMLGDAAAQQQRHINTEFVQQLVPAMRRHDVVRLLYQAGGLSAPPGKRLSPLLWAVRNTVARSRIGQHQDNEAVMRYLTDDAMDIDWSVHRAGIGSDGPSKGDLQRSGGRTSIATFRDCAAYSYRILTDPAAVHTCDTSAYPRTSRHLKPRM